MVYLDTSVLAAYYCPEAMSERAEAAIPRSDIPAISLLTQVELYSALSRKVREHTLSDADATRIAARFRLHIDNGCYVLLPVETAHYEFAREWIGRFSTSLKTLDALHLAICFSSDAVLLTADTGLAKAAKRFGVQTQVLSCGPRGHPAQGVSPRNSK